MAEIPQRIEDAVRDNDPLGPGRKVMIPGLERTVATYSPFTIQLPEVLLGLGVHRKVRISVRLILVDQLSDPQKLSVAVRVAPTGETLANLSPSDSCVLEPSIDRVWSNRGVQFVQLFRQFAREEVCVDQIFLVRFASNVNLQALNQVGLFRRIGSNFFGRPAPGRRTLPATGSSCS